jgi:hypothetical protein
MAPSAPPPSSITGNASAASEEPKAMSEAAARACSVAFRTYLPSLSSHQHKPAAWGLEVPEVLDLMDRLDPEPRFKARELRGARNAVERQFRGLSCGRRLHAPPDQKCTNRFSLPFHGKQDVLQATPPGTAGVLDIQTRICHGVTGLPGQGTSTKMPVQAGVDAPSAW